MEIIAEPQEMQSIVEAARRDGQSAGVRMRDVFSTL